MLEAIYNFPLGLNNPAYCFAILLVTLIGVMLLCYTITATMAHTSKQQDDMEQLALKFSHKK